MTKIEWIIPGGIRITDEPDVFELLRRITDEAIRRTGMPPAICIPSPTPTWAELEDMARRYPRPKR